MLSARDSHIYMRFLFMYLFFGALLFGRRQPDICTFANVMKSAWLIMHLPQLGHNRKQLGVNLAQPLCKDNVCLSVLTWIHPVQKALSHMCELEPGNTWQHPLQIKEVMYALIDTHVDLSMVVVVFG